MKCDHNGKNTETVYTNSAIGYETRYIVGGKLFGLMIGDCPEIGKNADAFYASIDFAAKKIKEIEIPD